jgi:hypothetical protein
LTPETWANFRRAIGGSGEDHESLGIRQGNVPQLQNHPPQGRGPRDLHGPTSQAASRLIAA